MKSRYRRGENARLLGRLVRMSKRLEAVLAGESVGHGKKLVSPKGSFPLNNPILPKGLIGSSKGQEQEQLFPIGDQHAHDACDMRTTRVTDEIPFVKEFEAFWDSYPRKEAKTVARKAWCARVKVVPPETLVLAAKHYATASYGRERQHMLLPSTFLGPSLRFEDYIKEPEVDFDESEW